MFQLSALLLKLDGKRQSRVEISTNLPCSTRLNLVSPHYLSTLVPHLVGNTSTHNLRNANDIGTVHANSQLYYSSFLPSAIRTWNEL